MDDERIQLAMLALIESIGSWNAFDGAAIVRALRANRGVWRTAIIVGAKGNVYFESNIFVKEERDFSAHRGLPETLFGYDTLQFTPVVGRESELEAIVNTWGPDSIDWYGLPNAGKAIHDEGDYVRSGGDPKRVVLEAWWD
jgi:hypothetical protein